MAHPSITLLPKRDARARSGHPWVFSNEVDMTPEAKALPPGTLVNLKGVNGEPFGTYIFNPRTLIALRRLSGTHNANPNVAWFAERLRHAVRRRERLFPTPHYRMVHSEGDDLPGLVVDRFGPILVAQISTAGMDLLKPALEEALLAMDGVEAILWRADAHGRTLEGLPTDGEPEISGTLPKGAQTLTENGLSFHANLQGGQKTGWFYDQRANRAFVANLAKGQTVLDVCTHTGGFALNALAHGATHATLVDASGPALELAAQSATLQKVGEKCTMIEGDMFEAMEHLAKENQRYGVVICDPPAFIKNAKLIPQGLKGYEKAAKHAAQLTAGGGYLTLCSCSHHAHPDAFVEASLKGIRKAGRSGRILRLAGADADHPQNFFLAENAYLKCLTVQLD